MNENILKKLIGLHFVYWNSLIYYIDDVNDYEHLCISACLKKKIFELIHNQQHHSDFHRIYDHISVFLFLCCLARHLKTYITHYLKYQLNQTKHHTSYSALISISTLLILFYTITMNFVLVLSSATLKDYDNFLTVTNKFTKQVLLLFS